MTSQAPPTPRQPFLSVLLPWLVLPVLAGMVFAGWGTLRAPSAYGYVTGTEVVATTRAGTSCTSTTVLRGAGSSGTKCPATWTVDGQEVRGTLTTHYGGSDESITTGAGSYRAVAWGDTATPGYDAFDLRWGLLSPFALVLGAAYLWWTYAGLDRRLAAKVRRDVRRGRAVPWGPFVLHSDGLQLGEHRLPWHLVGVASEGKVQGERITERTVRLRLGDTVTDDLFPPLLPESGAFTRVVRTLGSA